MQQMLEIAPVNALAQVEALHARVTAMQETLFPPPRGPSRGPSPARRRPSPTSSVSPVTQTLPVIGTVAVPAGVAAPSPRRTSARDYLDRHEVKPVLQQITQQLLVHQPDDALLFMIQTLARIRAERQSAAMPAASARPLGTLKEERHEHARVMHDIDNWTPRVAPLAMTRPYHDDALLRTSRGAKTGEREETIDDVVASAPPPVRKEAQDGAATPTTPGRPPRPQRKLSLERPEHIIPPNNLKRPVAPAQEPANGQAGSTFRRAQTQRRAPRRAMREESPPFALLSRANPAVAPAPPPRETQSPIPERISISALERDASLMTISQPSEEDLRAVMRGSDHGDSSLELSFSEAEMTFRD